MKKLSAFLGLIAALVVIDQITKWFVSVRVAPLSSHPIIPGFFNITRIHNKGAILGAFSQTGNRLVFWLLTAGSLVALAFVVYYFVKTPVSDWKIRFALSLILAGALGNLVDRVFRGYVIDFLDFYVKRWHWPFFNVADSCITVGAALLVLFFILRKPECSPFSSA